MTKDIIRQIVVAVSAVLALVGSFIGSGAAGGTPIEEAAGGALAADATTIAPGGPAFSIWFVIYLGLIAYAVWQLLPAQRSAPRQRRIGYPAAASMLLNAAWILSVQAGLLAVSVIVIALLLAVLCWLFVALVDSRPSGTVEAIVLDGTMGLYLGWVTIATVANIAAALTAAGFDGFGLDPDVWGAILAAVAGLLGLGLAVRGRGRAAPALSLSWGLLWVAVARFAGEPAAPITAIAAVAAIAVVLLSTLVLRFISPHPEDEGEAGHGSAL